MTKKNYFYCRLCGYVRQGNEGICPCCGAPQRSFVPYNMKVSERRLKFLELDIHPITTHLSVGFTIMLAVLFFIGNFITAEIEGLNIGYGGVLDFFVVLLPLFVLITGISGIIDGKLRYRKLKTPYLTYKLILGPFFLIVSLVLSITHFASNGGQDQILFLIELTLVLISMASGSILGLIGSRLVCPIAPTGQIKKN